MRFHDLSFKDAKGNEVLLSHFKGKALLIVNTATRCGLAPQFDALERIYQKYRQQNFGIIGFPCNQFANQEPETNDSMTETCRINHGVTFPLSEKILVNGENAHPVFAWLKANAKGGLFGKKIKWNFTKFLVSADGTRVQRYAPTTKPEKIEKDILAFLRQAGQT